MNLYMFRIRITMSRKSKTGETQDNTLRKQNKPRNVKYQATHYARIFTRHFCDLWMNVPNA